MSEATTPANPTDQIAATTAYDWGYDDSDGTDETCFVLGRKTDRGFEILAQVYGDGGKHLAAYIERLEAERAKHAVLFEAAKAVRIHVGVLYEHPSGWRCGVCGRIADDGHLPSCAWHRFLIALADLEASDD